MAVRPEDRLSQHSPWNMIDDGPQAIDWLTCLHDLLSCCHQLRLDATVTDGAPVRRRVKPIADRKHPIVDRDLCIDQHPCAYR